VTEYFEELKPAPEPAGEKQAGPPAAGPTWVDVGGGAVPRAVPPRPAPAPRQLVPAAVAAPGTLGRARPARRPSSRLALPRSRRGRLLLAALAVVVVLGVASTVYASAKLSALPNPGAAPVLAKSTVFLDRNGDVLAEHNPQGQFHIVQRLAEMGKWAPLATVGAEDKDFYKHGALDPAGVARAIIVDTLARKPLQGGSTISQQLVKITVLQSDKTFTRKLKEALISNQLERRYSKDQILEMYMNRLYYGHGAYGIGSATKTYFGRAKETRDLSVGQAAFLAGLIQAPSGNDPKVHFDRARERQLYVLDQMVQGGFITRTQADAAGKEDIQSQLVYDTSYRESKAPHFIDYVAAKVEAQFGPDALQQGGLTIRTTLDPGIQAIAEQSVAKGVQAMSAMGVNNGDLLAARPATGEVLAWVGSADYGNQAIGGQFDVIRSPRQPGSSFKPYAYEAALKDHKITLSSCVQDRPTDFSGYRPLDYDNTYLGTMTARRALVLSRNVPAVAVAQKEGIANVINLADAMGIRSTLPPYLSTSIGGGEVTMLDHVQGYSVFADEGKKMPLITISRITDSSGSTLFDVTPGHQPNQQQVLSPSEAYLMTDVLKGYQSQWGLGWGRQMAGKSGTTGGSALGVHSDAWMMAYNRDIVVGGWAGNTGQNGAGRAISAFGVNTGETLLASFINALPADWNHWYQKPADLVARNGELYLPGTQNNPDCAQAPTPSNLAPAPAPRGGGGKKKGGDHGGD
jgi:membrane peptidoglycan carboxypeptidase